jgi:hypothetical protein
VLETPSAHAASTVHRAMTLERNNFDIVVLRCM